LRWLALVGTFPDKAHQVHHAVLNIATSYVLDRAAPLGIHHHFARLAVDLTRRHASARADTDDVRHAGRVCSAPGDFGWPRLRRREIAA
jgi:hypothetical protein